MSNMTATMASIGKVFMVIMYDFYERSNDPDFDVAVEMDDLYKDLSNLYFKNTSTPQQ